MDPLNTKAIAENDINPAIDRVLKEVIPSIQAAVRAELATATVAITETVSTALAGCETLLALAEKDLNAALDRLDGMELTIGPVDIPAFTITLTLPKSQKVV